VSEQQVRKKSMSTFWRVFPGIAFAVALCAIVFTVYGNTDLKNKKFEARYIEAKKSMTELLRENANVEHVEKWRKLSAEFFVIYNNKVQGEKRAASLFLAAEATEILANYTLDEDEYKEAIERYEHLALNYSKNALADDALYRAASLRVEQFKDTSAALKILKRISTQYRSGDMLRLALNLEKKLIKGIIPADIRKHDNISGFMKSLQYMAKINPNSYAEKVKKDLEKIAANKQNKDKVVQLTKIFWDSKTGTQVEIIIELSKFAKWQAVLQKNISGADKNDRIVLSFNNTTAIPQLRSGAKIQGSILTQISLHYAAKNSTKVYFDFKAVQGYEIKVIKNPYKLIILVDARKKFKNKGIRQNSKYAEIIKRKSFTTATNDKESKRKAKIKAESNKKINDLASVNKGRSLNLAEQLSLGIRSIFIDAGHGGKDPGAVKNKIVESKITLDIAKRLGALLENKGFKVYYSRTKDISIPLSSRSQRANKLKADIFVSLHVNANIEASVSGLETYYLDFATTKRAAMAATLENAISDRTLGQLQTVMASIMLNEKKYESIRLAEDIKKITLEKIINKGFKVNDGGARSAPFHVLIDASMPSVLIEVGYCTNINDAKKLLTPKYRQAVAEGIANGIIRYNARFKAGGV